MASAPPLPRVCLIYTGGTIGMVREGGLIQPPSRPQRLTSLAPEIRNIARIEYVFILNKDSTNMNPRDWTLIATTIQTALNTEDGTWGQDRDPFAGVVVVHGTDTMHFSASAVAFALGANLNSPVVFTG